jgi:hypothetical protein
MKRYRHSGVAFGMDQMTVKPFDFFNSNNLFAVSVFDPYLYSNVRILLGGLEIAGLPVLSCSWQRPRAL